MKSITFSEFRRTASEILDRVEAGEEISIQRHGKVVAQLVPPGERKPAAWKKPGLKLVTKAPSLSRAILEDRR